MNDRTLKALNSLPKREVPNFKISARSVAAPKPKASPKAAPRSILKSRFVRPPAPVRTGWFPDDPKKPFIKGPDLPEEVKPVERSNDYSFFKEADVNVLDKSSLQKIRDICRGRLGGLVIRRVKAVLPSKDGVYQHYLHQPEGRRLLGFEEFEALDEETRKFRTETVFEGEYSLITSKKSALITHDKFEGQTFFARSSGRSEFDPMTLQLELAEGRPMPRVSNRKSTNEDDPASLICGYASRDPNTRKLVLKRWTIISIQEQRAILALIEPTTIHPSTKKGEIKDSDSYRAWLLGAGRLSTNLFRRKVLSEKSAKTPFTDEEKEAIYTRYVGGPWGLHHCHILVFWVLMCRYGELPGDDNIPTVVPTIPPNDPEMLEKWYEDKPLGWWDLPKVPSPIIEGRLRSKKLRMDEYLVEKLGLKFSKKRVAIPVHERVRFPKKVLIPPPLEKQEGQNDVGELVLAPVMLVSSTDSLGRTSSPAGSDSESDSEATSGLSVSLDSGLSSDSETSRSATPSTEVEVVAQEAWVFKSTWADLAEDDEEMDFEAPLSLSPLSTSTSSLASTLVSTPPLSNSIDSDLTSEVLPKEAKGPKGIVRDSATEADLVDDLFGSPSEGSDEGWTEASRKKKKKSVGVAKKASSKVGVKKTPPKGKSKTKK